LRKKLTAILGIFVILSGRHPDSAAQPPLETYGRLPLLRAPAISPSGKHPGYVSHANNDEALILPEMASRAAIGGLGTNNIKA